MTEGKRLKLERERALKLRDRTHARALKKKINEIKLERPSRLAKIRGLCRQARQSLRAQIITLREETRAELKRRVEAMREAQRGTCDQDKRSTLLELAKAVEQARAELMQWEHHLKVTYGRKAGAPGLAKARARERREESDDEVRRNLPPELVPVWHKVKTSIKAGPRRTRTEAFLEWVEDNSGEAHGIVYEAIERDVARMLKEHGEAERRHRGRGYSEADEAAALSAVPF
jgi:hypothetical protein